MHTELSSANTDDSLLFEPLLETNLGVRGYRHRHGVESSSRLGWFGGSSNAPPSGRCGSSASGTSRSQRSSERTSSSTCPTAG
jgi:hypothetical protein